jgi:hypothetical protein
MTVERNLYVAFGLVVLTNEPLNIGHKCTSRFCMNIVMDLINALLGNSCVNMVQHARVEEAVFSVNPTDVPIGWLDSDHVICLL